MHNNASNTATPELVVMMGLPAAGKSWVAEGRYTDTHSFVDCDAIKETHPDYDPLNPQGNSRLVEGSCGNTDARGVLQPNKHSL